MKLATHLTSKERIYDNLEHLNLVVTLIQSESQHRAKTKHFLPFSLSLTLFDLCPLLFSSLPFHYSIPSFLSFSLSSSLWLTGFQLKVDTYRIYTKVQKERLFLHLSTHFFSVVHL